VRGSTGRGGLVLCVPRYIRRTMPLGGVTQAAAAFLAFRARSAGWSTTSPPRRVSFVGQPVKNLLLAAISCRLRR